VGCVNNGSLNARLRMQPPVPCMAGPGARAIRTSFVCVIAILIGATTALAGTQPIVTTDFLKIRKATAIDVARDGSRAVVAVHSFETVEPETDDDADAAANAHQQPEYHQRSHLYLFNLLDRNAAPRQMTFGNQYDTDPQLSPDGRRIAFVRKAEGAAHSTDEDQPSSQIWLLPVDGGEARQVTDMDRGARNPVWSPDGRTILFQSAVDAYDMDGQPSWAWERPGRSYRDADPDQTDNAAPVGTRAQIRAWLQRNSRDGKAVVLHRLDFQREQSLRDETLFTQLFTVPVDDPDAQPTQLTSAFADHEGPAYMPNGRRIVYSRKKMTGEHPDRVLAHEIRMLDVPTGNDQMLLSRDGWSLQQPRPSRDGTLIALRGRRMDNPAYRPWQLGIASVDETAANELAWLTGPSDEDGQTQFDGDASDIRWSDARPALLFRTARRGGFPLMQTSPALLEPTEYIAGSPDAPFGVHEYDTAGGVTVYSRTDPSNPCVLRVRDKDSDRLLLDLNEWVQTKRLSKPRGAWLERPDGLRIHYWIMEPTNREPQQTYPLCLAIHGGPMVMWGPGEATMWHEFQLLCSWGYGIVYANPRGSDGYGYDFVRANENNWGDGPAGDCLAAVDAALLEPWVDDERLVVTGGSYAGYLTAWIVGHDHRFKAAVAQRGVYDLETFFGEGNAWRLVPWCFGGYPWEPRVKPVLNRESPFTYVNRIRTPLLIMHASQDLRTGVSQSEMLYRGLKVLGKPVEYIRYPNAGHDLSRSGDPIQRLDRLNRIIEFFERHIENPRPAPME